MKVRQIQEQLNVIAQAYPALRTVDVDGVSGEATQEAVRQFHRFSDFRQPESLIIRPGIRSRKFMWE